MKKILIIFLLFFSITINCYSQKIFVGNPIRFSKSQHCSWDVIYYTFYYCGMINEKVFSLAYKISAVEGTMNHYYPITTKSISFQNIKFNIIDVTSDYIVIELINEQNKKEGGKMKNFIGK